MNARRLSPLFAFCLGLAVAVPLAFAAPSPKEQKVRKLLLLTGADQMGKQMLDTMLQQFDQMPGLPPGFTAKFRELAIKEDLAEMVVPVYMKHLAEPDLDATIKFYESAAGKNFVKAQPAIVAESTKIGENWGRALAERAMKELENSKPK